MDSPKYRYFPIKTDTACQSKWAWSTIFLNKGASASCHRVKPVAFTLEEFDNFHNLPKKLDDRRLMLEGKWPTGGCEYCQEIEVNGGFSDRQHNLDIPNLTPPELEIDPTAVVVSPTILEIFAENTCNLKCTYCMGDLSSGIEQENKKYGWIAQDGSVANSVNDLALLHRKYEINTQAYLEKFYAYLAKTITTLKRLHLLGGETFLQRDLIEKVFATIEQHPNPELELCIFSNFNVPEKLFYRYVDWARDLHERGNIKDFDLTASIDNWGAEAEYARSGLDLALFEKEFAYAASQPWLRLNVNQTITSLTIRTMPELIEKINHYSDINNRHIGHYFQLISHYDFQHPRQFGGDFWAQDFEHIFQVMRKDTDMQQEAVMRMEGQWAVLKNSQANTEMIDKLRKYLDELDRRRNTNWRSVFAYLDVDTKNTP